MAAFKSKMVVVMRRDLRNSDGNKLPKGKLIAQGGHGYAGALLQLMTGGHESFMPEITNGEYELKLTVKEGSFLDDWIRGIFTKICLGVDSEKELLDIYTTSRQAGLNTVLIQDQGHTQFSEPTYTCIGIGPHNEEEIDRITGHLKSY